MKLFLVFLLCLLGDVSPGEVHKKPLTVSLFYESYCPPCIGFFNKHLTTAFKKLKGKIIIDLVPYGNTEQRYVNGHWEFSCQHGPKECLANKLHQCAIYQMCGRGGTANCDVKKVGQVIDYIDCVTREEDQFKASQQCARSSGLRGDTLLECSQGDRGQSLMHSYGSRTDLVGHKYTPWVTVDGVHDKNAEQDLVDELCRQRPNMCR